MLFRGDRKLDDFCACLAPFAERELAPSHRRLGNGDRNESLNVSPDDAHTVAANVELGNLTDMYGQGHKRLLPLMAAFRTTDMGEGFARALTKINSRGVPSVSPATPGRTANSLPGTLSHARE